MATGLVLLKHQRLGLVPDDEPARLRAQQLQLTIADLVGEAMGVPIANLAVEGAGSGFVLDDAVTLEDDVFCGPSMVFTNVFNPRAAVLRKAEYRRTLVRRGATLGANCTVVCGHTIGAWAFVGAGAVVTADVPEFALVVGVPARRITPPVAGCPRPTDNDCLSINGAGCPRAS